MNSLQQTPYFGKHYKESTKALIMAHGRGSNGSDIVNSMAPLLPVSEFYILSPTANNNTWYPFSFLEPRQANEPALSNSLSLLNRMLNDLIAEGFKSTDIFLLGFSQGACLILDFAAGHAQQLGGVFAFTGGLIGEVIDPRLYRGDFAGTPIFLGCSDRDRHVPVQRVNESAALLSNMGAKVIEKIYPGMGHTINQDEILIVTKLLNESKREKSKS